MLDARCPGCKSEPEHTKQDDGDVITCMHCGYVGIWEETAGGWRVLTSEEHASLMKTEAFLEAIQFGFAFRAWRERDALNLCAVIHSKLDRAGVSASLIESLRDEIMSAGYHTHPTDSDLAALGIDKYGDNL
ncbi:hypothetical protein NTR1_23 [Nocardia phage NTR1]|nr:hypothetical protein NTR1_23 [Nocardia phage NTR1]